MNSSKKNHFCRLSVFNFSCINKSKDKYVKKKRKKFKKCLKNIFNMNIYLKTFQYIGTLKKHCHKMKNFVKCLFSVIFLLITWNSMTLESFECDEFQ